MFYCRAKSPFIHFYALMDMGQTSIQVKQTTTTNVLTLYVSSEVFILNSLK